MAKSTKSKDISYNEGEAWGQLKNPRSHTAAVGVRFCDNRRRELQSFSDRFTVVGQEDVAKKLQKWVFSKKTIRQIVKNTRFVYGAPAFEWTETFDIGNDISVELVVKCAGEYCYVAAYADIVSFEINLVPLKGEDGSPQWGITFNGSMYAGVPRVIARTRSRARKLLENYLLNELDGRDDIVDDGD